MLDTFFLAGLLDQQCEKNYNNGNPKSRKDGWPNFPTNLFCCELSLLAN